MIQFFQEDKQHYDKIGHTSFVSEQIIPKQ